MQAIMLPARPEMILKKRQMYKSRTEQKQPVATHVQKYCCLGPLILSLSAAHTHTHTDFFAFFIHTHLTIRGGLVRRTRTAGHLRVERWELVPAEATNGGNWPFHCVSICSLGLPCADINLKLRSLPRKWRFFYRTVESGGNRGFWILPFWMSSSPLVKKYFKFYVKLSTKI